MMRPYIRIGKLDDNSHIYRRGKFGPHFGRRVKGWLWCQLGGDTHLAKPRNHWGVRLWLYRYDGACVHIDMGLVR